MAIQYGNKMLHISGTNTKRGQREESASDTQRPLYSKKHIHFLETRPKAEYQALERLRKI